MFSERIFNSFDFVGAMCVYTCTFMCDNTHVEARGQPQVSVAPSSLFIAVCSGLTDLLVSGGSSVPTSLLEEEG